MMHEVIYLGRVVEVSLSFASILLFSSSLVTPCVLVPFWLLVRFGLLVTCCSELSVKQQQQQLMISIQLIKVRRGTKLHEKISSKNCRT